jgi:hypothetical protein
MIGPRLRIPRLPSTLLLPVLGCVLLGAVPCSHAQQYVTAERKADLTVFGAYNHSRTDYGTPSNQGATIGTDYSRYFKFWIVPSLEFRGTYTRGSVLNEYNALGGLRGKHDFGRYHPYGDFLYGATWIHYNQPPSPTYTHDQATTRSIGGGVDIDVYRNFQFKADYQHEVTNYGFNALLPKEQVLTPDRYNFGVVYRIPFKKHTGHGYEDR